MNAEHYFGQAEADRRLVANYPVVAGQRQLEAAAEAMAVDQCHAGHVQRFQPVHYPVGEREHFGRLLAGFDRAELGDVGSGDESVLFRRADEQRGGVGLLDFCQGQVQFGDDFGG